MIFEKKNVSRSELAYTDFFFLPKVVVAVLYSWIFFLPALPLFFSFSFTLFSSPSAYILNIASPRPQISQDKNNSSFSHPQSCHAQHSLTSDFPTEKYPLYTKPPSPLLPKTFLKKKNQNPNSPIPHPQLRPGFIHHDFSLNDKTPYFKHLQSIPMVQIVFQVEFVDIERGEEGCEMGCGVGGAEEG